MLVQESSGVQAHGPDLAVVRFIIELGHPAPDSPPDAAAACSVGFEKDPRADEKRQRNVSRATGRLELE